jgi:UDP-glucose:(heptosyl)LPS alpha-1,3-glucosyltransferase
MKPKIAIIIERADVALGGAERSVFELTEAIAETGFEAHIIAAGGQSQMQNVCILCPDSPGGRTGCGTFARVLKSHISKNHYDIIHSVLPFDFADIYQPRGGTYAEAIRQNAASYCNGFVGWWKRATAFTNFRRAQLLRAEKNLCKIQNGPVIIAISKYVAEQFGRHYEVEASRVTVIPNGVRPVDSVGKEQAERFRNQVLAGLNVSETDKPVLFLFAANNFRLKGLGCLIEAMRSVLRGSFARPVFLMVVGGDRTIGYERLAENCGVDKNILFLGKVDRIADVLAAADVAVLPTFYDPCSRFVLEALAAGKPVITTKFNGAAEMFTDNRHGRVIDRPDDIDKLAGALSHFIDAKNIENASRAIIEDNIKQQVSISRVAGQMKKVYDDILAKRRRR